MNPVLAGEALIALLGVVVPTFAHPVDSMPREDGRVLPAAAVALHVPRDGYRMAGRRSNGVASATIHCVGSTRDECLWVAVRVREALDGYRLTPTSGTAREDSYAGLEPAVVPNADPRRFEVPLVFNFPL